MTEPKVVHAHKWDDDDGWGHLVRTDGGYYQGAECEEHEDRRFDLVDEIPVDVAIELARLAARVQELEDSLEARRQERDDLKQRVDNCNKNAGREITRLREALVGIGAAAMRWKMRAGEVGDRVRSREGIQHTINLVEAALKETP